jgi:hypothetical protein
MRRICSSAFRTFMTHMANSTLAGSGHAAGYTTMPRACLGSSSNSSNNNNNRSSNSKVGPHLPQVVHSKAGRDIRFPWGITHHIHKTSTTAPPTTMHTPSHNHSSNSPPSHLAPAPHRARRAPRASNHSHTAKAKVRGCMVSNTSKATTNPNWVTTRMRTAIHIN